MLRCRSNLGILLFLWLLTAVLPQRAGSQSLEAVAESLSSRIAERVEAAPESTIVTLIGFTSSGSAPVMDLVGVLEGYLKRHARFGRFQVLKATEEEVAKWEDGEGRFVVLGQYRASPPWGVEWDVTLVDRVKAERVSWMAYFAKRIETCPHVTDFDTLRNLILTQDLDALPAILEEAESVIEQRWEQSRVVNSYWRAVNEQVERKIQETSLPDRLTVEFRRGRAREIALSMFAEAMEDPQVVNAFADFRNALAADLEPRLRLELRRIRRHKLSCVASFLARQDNESLADAFLFQTNPPDSGGVEERGLPLEEGFEALPSLESHGLSEVIAGWIAGEIQERIAEAVARKILGRMVSRAVPLLGQIQAVLGVFSAAKGGFIRELGDELKTYENCETLRQGVFVTSRRSIERHFVKSEGEIGAATLQASQDFAASMRSLLEQAVQQRDLWTLLMSLNGYQLLQLREVSVASDRQKLLDALENAALQDLVDLPEWQFALALAMVKETKDPAEPVAWLRVIPAQLRRVVESRIYSVVPIRDLAPEIVIKLLGLQQVSSMAKFARLDGEDRGVLLLLRTAELEALGQAEEQFVRIAVSVGRAWDQENLSGFVGNILGQPKNLEFFAEYRERLIALGPLDEKELLAFTSSGQGFFSRAAAIIGARNPGLLLRYFMRVHWVALVFSLIFAGVVAGMLLAGRRGFRPDWRWWSKRIMARELSRGSSRDRNR